MIGPGRWGGRNSRVPAGISNSVPRPTPPALSFLSCFFSSSQLVVLTLVRFHSSCQGATWQCLGTRFVSQLRGGRFYWHPSGWGLWMGLNTLQCLGQPPRQSMFWSQMPRGPRASSPAGPETTFQEINEHGGTASQGRPSRESLRVPAWVPPRHYKIGRARGSSLPAGLPLSCLWAPEPHPPAEKLKAVLAHRAHSKGC